MRRIIMRILVLTVSLAMFAGALRAADDAAPGNTNPSNDSVAPAAPASDSLPASKSNNKSLDGKPTTKTDPIDIAFTLPNHRKVDQLTTAQQQAYQQLKDKMTPKLQQAQDKVTQASGLEKATAEKEMLKLRKDIQTEIRKLLGLSVSNAKNSSATAKKSSHGKRGKRVA
jgi:hypothetical protein